METLDDENKQNQALNNYCEICDYTTSRKSNYATHLSTDKHKRLTKDLQMRQKTAKNQQLKQVSGPSPPPFSDIGINIGYNCFTLSEHQ